MKLVLWFRTVSMGAEYGVVVPKYYNVKKPAPAARSRYAFSVGAKSDFFRDYARLFDKAPERRNRISMDKFRGRVFEAEVRFVERDSRQRSLSKGAQYSVIERFVRVVA